MGEDESPPTELEKVTISYSVQEVLYFFQNAINIMTRTDIMNKAKDFYSEATIEDAKQILWSKCKNHVDRYNIRKGQEKQSLNINDMIDCFKKIDWTKCPIRFVSADASKVPSFNSDSCSLVIVKQELDIIKAKQDRFSNVEEQIAMMRLELVAMKDQVAKSSEKVISNQAQDNYIGNNSFAEVVSMQYPILQQHIKTMDESLK